MRVPHSGRLPSEPDGRTVDAFLVELATLRACIDRILEPRRGGADAFAELRLQSSGLDGHVLSLMDEVQKNFREIRRKLGN